jgi:rhodanese-related sulfurtransferase
MCRVDQAVLIDIREPDEFITMRIPGARLHPLSVLRHLPDDTDQDKPAVYFCHSGNRTAGAMELLARRGHPECLILDGGISAWAKSGLPVEKSRTALPIMRQVHIAVGMLILAGMGLGTIIPAFLLLPILVGAGLFFPE